MHEILMSVSASLTSNEYDTYVICLFLKK